MSGLLLLCTKFTLFCNEIPENCNYLNQSKLSNFFMYNINIFTTQWNKVFPVYKLPFGWSGLWICHKISSVLLVQTFHVLPQLVPTMFMLVKWKKFFFGTIKLIRVLHSGHYHQPKLIIKLMCFFSQDVMMIRDKII